MNITDEQFEKEVLNNKEVTLVKFHADWCGPCRVLGKVLDKLPQDLKVRSINVEDELDTTSEYKIKALPTLVFFKGGQEVSRLTGSQKLESLIQEFKKHE